MQRTLAELKQECTNRGISYDPNKKYSKRDLIDKLAEYSINQMGGWDSLTYGQKMRYRLISPMLCFHYKNLKPHEQKAVLDGPGWIMEEKWNGARMVICYHPDEGFSFFSRNISVEDFLPIEYTHKILLIKDGKVTTPSDWIGKFKQSFVKDSEVLATGNIDTSSIRKNGTQTGHELNAATAILALETEDSHKIQMEQAQLHFKIFDILHLGSRKLWKLPLSQRKEILGKTCSVLSPLLPMEESKWVATRRRAFVNEIMNRGGEGGVAKAIDRPYICTESRPRHTQVKVKRTVSGAQNEDVDAFVSGYVDAKEGKMWAEQGLIGALKLSVILKKKDGTEEDHWIATVGSMPLKLREEMSEPGPNGPQLKKEYYGRVVTCDGQAVTPKSLRFSHAVIDWGRGFRHGKNRYECVMSQEELEANIV